MTLGLVRSSRPDSTFTLELPFIERIFKTTLCRAMAQEDRKLCWNRENEVDEKWIQLVDHNVLAGETLQDD